MIHTAAVCHWEIICKQMFDYLHFRVQNYGAKSMYSNNGDCKQPRGHNDVIIARFYDVITVTLNIVKIFRFVHRHRMNHLNKFILCIVSLEQMCIQGVFNYQQLLPIPHPDNTLAQVTRYTSHNRMSMDSS